MNQISKNNIVVMGMGTYAYGLEKQTVEALTNMNNVNPFFLISKYDDGSVAKLLDENSMEYKTVSFGYLGFSKPHWTLINLIQIPLLYFHILKECIRRKPKTLLVLNIHPILNAFIPLLFLKHFLKLRVVFYFHNVPNGSKIYGFFYNIVNNFADKIIAISYSIKRSLLKMGLDKDKITVVYNGLDLDKFKSVRPIDFKSNYKWKEGDLVVGYIGQLSLLKGVNDFIDAAKLVNKIEKNIRFIIIGDSLEDKKYKESLIKSVKDRSLSENIQFTGWLDNIENAYSSIDIVVVPSIFDEPFGLINIEAMASKTPVIATRTGGIPEIVIHGETGFLVDKNCPEQIADRILELDSNADMRLIMGSNGKNRVYNLFNIRKNALIIEGILLHG